MKKSTTTMKKIGFSAAFTIVELIIVIAVIGILATLTSIGLGEWRTGVARTEVDSTLSSIQAGMADYRNRMNTFPIITLGSEFDNRIAAPGTVAPKDIYLQSSKIEATYVRGSAQSYCVEVQSRDVPEVLKSIEVFEPYNNPNNLNNPNPSNPVIRESAC